MSLIILLFGVITTVAIGAVALRRDARSQTSLLFTLMAVAMSGWSVATYLSLDVGPDQLALIRLSMFFVVLMNTAFFYLLAVFPRRKRAWSGRYLVGMLFAVMALITTLSPWMFTGLEIDGSNVSPVPGPGIVIFLLHAVTFVGLSFALLSVRFRRSKGLERSQLRYVALGLAVFLILTPLTNFVLPILFKQSALVSLSPINPVLFALAIGYAIIQHRLMDIRLVLVHSVAYVATIAVLVTLYTFAMFGVGSVVSSEPVMASQTVLYAFLAIFVAITFQPLRQLVDSALRRLFYKSHYDESVLISEVTAIMAETLDLGRLTERSLERVVSTMQISNGGFWAQIDSDDFVCFAQHNLSDRQMDRIDTALLQAMCDDDECSIVVRSDGSAELRRAGMEVAVPLFAGDQLQGVLLLGEKKSGEMYTDQDIDALKILGSSLAISLENARSYKRISEFNVTLEKEVEKATHELTVANEKLSRNNTKLRQLDSLKDEFISITSHELRTPLTAIRGYLWMAMHGRGRDDAEKASGYMERAYTSTERLIALVNDSLDISRIDSGRVQLSPEPTDVVRLASEVATDLRPRALQQQQKLTVKRGTVKLPAVMVDPEKLYQVLTNLVGNALKFTPSKGSIEVSFVVDGNKLVTTVKDSGPGISAEDQKRLFQKFSRLDASATIPGTGLGLFLCKEIVQLSKGKIWVESRLGEGAAFHFSLPITDEKPIHSSKMIQHAQRVVLNNGQKT